MKMLALIWVFALALSPVFSQTYTLNTALNGSTQTTCSGTFLDDGGAGSNYTNNQNRTVTFYSGSSSRIRLTFSVLTISSNDILSFHDGTTIDKPMIENCNGTCSPLVTYVTSTGPYLTIHFTTNSSGTSAGWNATISCIPLPTNIVTCSSVFTDPGGTGNYGVEISDFTTICPSTPGRFTTLSFTSFDLENNQDYLQIFDGDGLGVSQIGIYTGTTIPPNITSSHSTGCLATRFFSDNTTTRPGWSANVTCSGSPGVGVPNSVQDCAGGGGVTICSNLSFGGNSNGPGAQELPFGLTGSTSDGAPWAGCINKGEHQSSWYYFSPISNGNIAFTIVPSNGSDDYDFALWGPYSYVQCPAHTGDSPLRCSWSATGGNTGLLTGAIDFTEGSSPPMSNKFVESINVIAGEVYVLMIDNFVASGSPFNLNWTFTGGVSLDCTPLAITLTNWNGKAEDNYNELNWTTSVEINNSYFTVEKSQDANNWVLLNTVLGAGNSAQANQYQLIDSNPFKTTYYRLIQTNFNGSKTTYNTISITRNDNGISNTIFRLYPNPVIDQFNLQTYLPGENKLNILDQNGKVVYSTVTNGKTMQIINLGPTISSGFYFISIENEGVIQHEKLIVKK